MLVITIYDKKDNDMYDCNNDNKARNDDIVNLTVTLMTMTLRKLERILKMNSTSP